MRFLTVSVVTAALCAGQVSTPQERKKAPAEPTFLDRTLAAIDGGSEEPGLVIRGETGEKLDSAPVPVASRRPPVTLNQPWPEFTLSDMTGRSWTLDDLHGRTTLVIVWATWCG